MTIQLSRRTVVLTAVAIAATLAIAVTALVRTADAGGNGFTDTPPWIADHAAWLVDNGIADGFDDNTFRPNDNITRGQAAFWFGNYNNAVELVESTTNPTLNAVFVHTTDCPVGRRAIAGGGDTSHSNMYITSSYPKDKTAANPTGWTVRWETDDDADVDPSEIQVWALCAPKTIPE